MADKKQKPNKKKPSKDKLAGRAGMGASTVVINDTG